MNGLVLKTQTANQENYWVCREILKTVCMKASGWMDRRMEEEYRYGQMGQDMMVSGEMELIMDMDDYVILLEIFILENGIMICNTAMEK